MGNKKSLQDTVYERMRDGGGGGGGPTNFHPKNTFYVLTLIILNMYTFWDSCVVIINLLKIKLFSFFDVKLTVSFFDVACFKGK